MKKITTMMLAVSMFLGMSAVANACSTGTTQGCTPTDTQYSLTDVTLFGEKSTTPTEDLNKIKGYGGKLVNTLEFTGDWVSWTHHYTFTPPAKGIKSAELTLDLYDFDPADKIITNTTTSKGCKKTTKISYDFSQLESALVLLEGGITRRICDVDTKSYEFDLNLKSLLDGAFSITLISTLNDFRIDKSTLDIVYCGEKVAPVPEPGTFALLGAGLLGLGLYGRKRTKK